MLIALYTGKLLLSNKSLTIIEQLSKDARFRSICKQIAKKPHLAEDLYQEFFLSLCEIKDQRLEDASSGGYLEVFCVGVIHNIWKNRGRVKKNKNGNTSPLHELSGIMIVPGCVDDSDNRGGYILDDHIPNNQEEYDHLRDINEQRLHQLIERYKESEDLMDRFYSRVFYYSKFKYKNVRQFSVNSKIPYGVCLRAYESFKGKIKEEMCKHH